jgi:hypothetical protein
VTALSNSRRVLVKAVVAELEELSQGTSQTAGWARRALKQVDWLGEPVRVDDVHRLLFSMITVGVIGDGEAADFAEALRAAGRAPDYTAEELRTGRLGRAGRP